MPSDKNTARQSGLKARAALGREERKEQDARIEKRVIEKIQNMNVIGCYVSMKDEVNTYGIIDWCLKHGRTVAVPRCEGNTLTFHRIRSFNDLAEGHFHVMEPLRDDPVDPEKMDMMIVPLSAFDEQNNRTGYGKGYYDSILAACPYKAGIAYRQQKTDTILCDPWDVRLDEVIYE